MESSPGSSPGPAAAALIATQTPVRTYRLCITKLILPLCCAYQADTSANAYLFKRDNYSYSEIQPMLLLLCNSNGQTEISACNPVGSFFF